MRAAAGLSDLDYRPGFDISLPAYSIHQEKPPPIKSNRKWLAVMPQINNIKSDLQRIMQEVEKDASLGIKSLEHCGGNVDGRGEVNVNIVKSPDILADSTFCIVLEA